MKHLSAIIALCVLGGAVSLRAANCKNWKQPVFWETAIDARVMWCLENGSNASVRGKDGRTPLLHATLFQRSPEIVRALLKRHVDSERQDKWNARPMHYAARNPDTTTVSTLLTFNARHSPENRWGLTPLHFAARYNPNADVIRTLLPLGVYASPSNDDGRRQFKSRRCAGVTGCGSPRRREGFERTHSPRRCTLIGTSRLDRRFRRTIGARSETEIHGGHSGFRHVGSAVRAGERDGRAIRAEAVARAHESARRPARGDVSAGDRGQAAAAAGTTRRDPPRTRAPEHSPGKDGGSGQQRQPAAGGLPLHRYSGGRPVRVLGRPCGRQQLVREAVVRYPPVGRSVFQKLASTECV